MTMSDIYRSQWATLTGRPESEIYIPEAIRPFEPVEGARVTCDQHVGHIERVASDGLARVRWSDGSASHERFDGNGETL